MKLPILIVSVLALSAAGIALASRSDETSTSAPSVERGKYLVNAMGCNDCHTPFKLDGPPGPPERDWDRRLSGHPETLDLPAAPKGEGLWNIQVAATLTAWSGPWGTSFTANLTPDEETGLGKWTVEDFIATMRTGRHLGKGRPILPPMPWDCIATFEDVDLASIFAYLQSLPPIKNHVPEPRPPAAQ
jgi:hypothetical protein